MSSETMSYLIKEYVKYSEYSFEDDDETLTIEDCEILIDAYPEFLRFVGKKIFSLFPQLCEIAVRKDGLLLEFVPDNLKNQTLCKSAISQNWNAINHCVSMKGLYRFALEQKQQQDENNKSC